MDTQNAIAQLTSLVGQRMNECDALKVALDVLVNGYQSDKAIIDAAILVAQTAADQKVSDIQASADKQVADAKAAADAEISAFQAKITAVLSPAVDSSVNYSETTV